VLIVNASLVTYSIVIVGEIFDFRVDLGSNSDFYIYMIAASLLNSEM
jgi:hypothetical protein